MSDPKPLFRAISTSARQIQLLLRCISFSNKAHVRISPAGLRFSTEDGTAMEAFVLLSNELFTTYSYNNPNDNNDTSSQGEREDDDDNDHPFFQINLASLIETLNIFALSDPAAAAGKRPGMPGSTDPYEAFATHRLQRHAGINNAFAATAPGIQGLCTFTYAGAGEPFRVHMSESGVTTTCALTTYEASNDTGTGGGGGEEIPFNRNAIALKTIMRSTHLLDAVQELAATNPSAVTISASPATRAGPDLSLSATGAIGEAVVEFKASNSQEAPVLETFLCHARTSASFTFALIKAVQRAMATASKVSLRLDAEGVLSLQFLVQIDSNGPESEGVAFVDFRLVPLVDEDATLEHGHSEEDGEADD